MGFKQNRHKNSLSLKIFLHLPLEKIKLLEIGYNFALENFEVGQVEVDKIRALQSSVSDVIEPLFKDKEELEVGEVGKALQDFALEKTSVVKRLLHKIKSVIQKNDLKTFEKLLQIPNINFTDSLLLNWICIVHSEKNQYIRVLLEAGADPNVACGYGLTPLIHAANMGALGAVEALLQANANVNAVANDVCVMQSYHISGGIIGGCKTALICAAEKGHLDVVARLLKVEGIKINAVDGRGDTALNLAVHNGKLEVAKQLIKSGADPNIANENGVRPLLSVVYEYLTAESKEDKTQILSVVTSLIAAGADIDAMSEEYLTALAAAIDFNAIEIVRVLVMCEANVNLECYDYDTALFFAAAKNKLEIMDVLLGGGANVDARDWQNDTPLSLSIREGHLEAASKLLDAGANPNIANSKTGDTALTWAVRYNRPKKFIDKLIKAGVNVNVVMRFDSELALVAMASKKYKYTEGEKDKARVLEIISTLLEAGADATLVDPEILKTIQEEKKTTFYCCLQSKMDI